MENNERLLHQFAPPGFTLAPIHCFNENTPLRICVCMPAEPGPAANPFVLVRELPGSRVYLGAICDADARIQEWVEVWVQTLDLRDVTFSGSQELLTNHVFDLRWYSEYEMCRTNLPDIVIVSGMEEKNPTPILIKRRPDQAGPGFAPVEGTSWRICKDDALLGSFGLPLYSTSSHRYLYEPEATAARTFLATAPDTPRNSHVQGMERLSAVPEVRAIFNPHAGLIRVNRFSPLGLEEYLQILEGRAWDGAGPEAMQLSNRGVYGQLQAWSASPKGMPFLLYGRVNSAESLSEIFFLKLCALRDLFKEVRDYVRTQQLPLLNLSPSSFSVRLPNVGDQFPGLWATKCVLVKPGQAHPLKIKSTEQKYFIRLGKVEPSPYLPEGLGAHSFGIGSIRIRNVLSEADGISLEGTLVAEEYLGLDPHDLLWFKLPLAEERLEFYAHVYASEAVGPKEARFRTVPAKLSESAVTSLKRVAGTVFPRSPYEIWPLLSSPCDLFSLGVMAVRILLANSQSNLPVILDEVLSLARLLGKDVNEESDLLPRLKSLIEPDQQLLDLVSPHALVESGDSPQQARSKMRLELWFDTIGLVLRLFPGAGTHSFCKSFGDVSPLALETVFDRPIEGFETLALRLRSVLVPSLSANEEIASVLLEQLATA